MTDPKLLREFLVKYQKYVRSTLGPSKDAIKAFLEDWKRPDYWKEYIKRSRLPTPSPIQRSFVRIKRPEAVVDKILRKPRSFPEGLEATSYENMTDAVGARIVTYFLGDLPRIDCELRKLHEQGMIEIDLDKNRPVAYLSQDTYSSLGLLNHIVREDKPSGYSSIHYILKLREIEGVAEGKRPWFELQVRTITQDVWGEIEHVLGYKPDKQTFFAVKKEFQILSHQLRAIDEHFNFLYEELSRYQEEAIYKDENPLNAENLPAVLNELGIGCAQKEIDGMLKLLNSRGIDSVGLLRSVATTKRLEIIRHTYVSLEGKPPRNFEIVANLAALREIEEGPKAQEVIQAQVAYLEAWDSLRGK